ncbi:hypothetical protein JR316_0000754 [Psilocybe cubensis]|uniref:DUF7702 domain-containing protein n=2 Tax=Psilocybe cubensis TaxID=181762 RepID=A0A8H7Y7Z6_PSICU|nr:hypothetical protein JR316_0000754 [Psilocybe cubensis]KAH9486689.1 hypothetical protein JR316_0000754 [Psilocybe cubensis]
MPQLDTRGQIAAAQIAFYAPIAIITFILVIKYALRRDAGWFFLFLFSIARLAQGALIVAAEMIVPPKPILFNAAYIMDYSALAFLLFSSLGFIGMAGQHTYSENPRITTILRLIGIFGLGGMGLCIAGGILNGESTANQSLAVALRRAGVCIYAGMYVIIFAVFIGTWTYRWHLRSYRRSLLFGLTCALPFLGVRMAYAVIAAFSSSDLLGTKLSSNTTLADLNPVTGKWILYLVLSLIMEYVVVALYLFASTILARRHRH